MSIMGDLDADRAYLILLLDFFLVRDFPEIQELHDFLLLVSLNWILGDKQLLGTKLRIVSGEYSFFF